MGGDVAHTGVRKERVVKSTLIEAVSPDATLIYTVSGTSAHGQIEAVCTRGGKSCWPSSAKRGLG